MRGRSGAGADSRRAPVSEKSLEQSLYLFDIGLARIAEHLPVAHRFFGHALRESGVGARFLERLRKTEASYEPGHRVNKGVGRFARARPRGLDTGRAGKPAYLSVQWPMLYSMTSGRMMELATPCVTGLRPPRRAPSRGTRLWTSSSRARFPPGWPQRACTPWRPGQFRPRTPLAGSRIWR